MIHALALTGPTASGKTAISIELSRALDLEVISCDSMQIYKGMDIGTAKVTETERDGTPHHLIDIISPNEQFSTETYRKMALEVARDITERGKMPIFVGGTGLYIDSLTRSAQTEIPESSEEYRAQFEKTGQTDEGREELWKRLSEVDPESAAAIHKNNTRRVIRALEIYDTTGKPKSYFDKLSRESEKDVSIGMITLDFHNRENLYSRVDRRVDIMISEGLVDEVVSLIKRGYLTDPMATASQAIGYKEIIAYLDGKCTLSEAVDTIKLSTRRYAKRQLTWFRHEKDAERLYLDLENGDMKPIDDVMSEAIEYANKYINTYKRSNDFK